jgi:hypothetical protein
MLSNLRKVPIPARDAVAGFLMDMRRATQLTFPGWLARLRDGVAECVANDNDAVATILGRRPIEDYYFAGVVAMEAARVRRLLSAEAASGVLAALAEQVDSAAGCTDRAVSDFLFFVLGRIDLETGVEQMRKPYDLVVGMLLDKIGLHEREDLRPLLADVVFRHNLGEPLARSIPAWWKEFENKFSILENEPDSPTVARSA